MIQQGAKPPGRVCMVTYKLPPFYGGAGLQALRLARKLVQKGLPVFMVTASHGRDDSEAFLDGVKVCRLPAAGPRRIRPLVFALAACLFLLRNRRSYDIVHLHGAYWRIVPMILAAKLLRKKTIVKMTSLGTDDPVTIRRRLLGPVLLGAVAMADAVVAMTDELASSYVGAGLPPGRLARIPNGVDMSAFGPVGSATRRELRATFGIPAGVPVVLFVGPVLWRKGVDLLLTAWQAVHEQFPEAVLLLVGPISRVPGAEERAFRTYLRDYVTNHSSPQRVHFLGQQTSVQRFYQMADIFVLPSRLEGLPNALLEAMACGLPCVVSDIPSVVEIVTHNSNGLVFESGNVERLANAISSLLSDEQNARSLGQRARQTVIAGYSLESVGDAYVRLYARISD